LCVAILAIEWQISQQVTLMRSFTVCMAIGVFFVPVPFLKRTHLFISKFVLVAGTATLLGTIVVTLEFFLWAPQPTVPMGAVCRVTGQVMSRTVTSGEQSLTVQVRSIEPVSEPGAVRRTRFLTHAFLPQESPTVSVNMKVTMRGFFLTPPVQSASGVPVQQILKNQGISSEFEGAVESTAEGRFNLSSYRIIVPTLLASHTHLSLPECNLLVSLLFGGTDVSVGEKQVFLRAGLMHLLAASGANVLLVERCFLAVWGPLCKRLPAARFVRLFGSVSAVWLFVAMCGGQPSILRAGLMTTYRQLGEACGRTGNLFNSLLVAAYLMSLWQPDTWQQPGTWLSFAATYAVGLALRRTSGKAKKSEDGSSVALIWCRRFLFGVWHLVRTTLLVEALTIPFTLHWFGQVSIVSVAANLVADPLIVLLLPVTLLLVVLCAMAKPMLPAVAFLMRPLAFAAAFLLKGLLACSQWLASWHDSFWTLSQFSWLDAAAWYTLLFIMLRASAKLKGTVQSDIIRNRG
jgi:ComEC/Rec2-related protein